MNLKGIKLKGINIKAYEPLLDRAVMLLTSDVGIETYNAAGGVFNNPGNYINGWKDQVTNNYFSNRKGDMEYLDDQSAAIITPEPIPNVNSTSVLIYSGLKAYSRFNLLHDRSPFVYFCVIKVVAAANFSNNQLILFQTNNASNGTGVRVRFINGINGSMGRLQFNVNENSDLAYNLTTPHFPLIEYNPGDYSGLRSHLNDDDAIPYQLIKVVNYGGIYNTGANPNPYIQVSGSPKVGYNTYNAAESVSNQTSSRPAIMRSLTTASEYAKLKAMSIHTLPGTNKTINESFINKIENEYRKRYHISN